MLADGNLTNCVTSMCIIPGAIPQLVAVNSCMFSPAANNSFWIRSSFSHIYQNIIINSKGDNHHEQIRPHRNSDRKNGERASVVKKCKEGLGFEE